MGLRRINLPSWLWTFSALLLLMIALSPIPSGARQFKTNARISVSSTGVQGANIIHPVINGNSNTVAFWSDRGGLVPEDSNNVGDVFVRTLPDQNNLSIGQTIRVSLGFGGVQTARTDGNLPISYPEVDIDYSGCIIVYSSDAMNITAQNGAAVQDVNQTTDVFAVNRCISGFPTNGFTTLHVSKLYTGQTSGFQAAGGNTNPRISTNGRYVVWRSSAPNLVAAGTDTNNAPDIFRMLLPDLAGWGAVNYANLVIERVNISNTEQQANLEDGSNTFDVNQDGNVIAFASVATNLVAGTDNNGVADIYIRNMAAGSTIRINGIGGALPNGASSNPSISDNGQYVAFRSNASNLVLGDTNGQSDIFLYNVAANTLERVSLSSEGEQANNGSDYPYTNDNGRYISFYSNASNLVFGDTNGGGDIFVHDRNVGITTRASVRNTGTQAAGSSGQFSSLTAGASLIVFDSFSSNIVDGDTNTSSDVFVGIRGPISPNGLMVTTKTPTSISLSWNDNSSVEDSVILQRRRPAQVDFISRQTLSPTATSFTDSDVNACSVYFYRVLSVQDGIQSPSNIVQVKTPGCPPGPFAIREPSEGDAVINPIQMDFRWTLSEEAITYTFTLSRTGTGQIYQTTVNHADVCSTINNRCIIVPDGTLQPLLINGSYSFTVTASNTIASGIGADNNPRSFSINTAGTPRDFLMYGPANNAIVRRVNTLGNFTWQNNRDAATYALNVIQVSTNTRLGSVIEQLSLTAAADGDNLTCDIDAVLCTYVPAGGEIAAMENGTFTWIVTAKSPSGTPREPSSGPFNFTVNGGDIEILINGGFETDANFDGIADGWTVFGSTSDKRKCNKPAKIITVYGNCAFNFVGGANENSGTNQKILDTGYGFIVGDEIQLNGFVKQKNLPADVVVKLEVRYIGAPKAKSTITIPSGTAANFTALAPVNITFVAPVKDIRVKIANYATFGSVAFDDISILLLAPDSPRRGLQYVPGTREVIDPNGTNSGANPVLPPPPPAEVDGFRGSN